jgi:N-acetylglutamate synthase-like GNAT family acetyltransferase
MENGTITYRLANTNDIDPINALYNRVYKRNRTKEEFNWEFNSAPAGKAIYVIALDKEKVVGTQCAIPYYFVNGKEEKILTAKSEDTLVDPAYRGKSIFEKMYALLFEESKKAGIQLIWGFTYAVKPFKKLGFEIPFRSCLGILVLKPNKAYSYLSSLNPKNSLIDKFKILGLSYKSYFDFCFLKKVRSTLRSSNERIPLNSVALNYLADTNYTGLLLDENFLNYRLYNNPYSKNYFQFSVFENGKLRFSAFYTINNGVGYILHLYLTSSDESDFIKQLIFETDLKNCHTIRFWGFTHNTISNAEIKLLKKNKFTFIHRGISFVGLNLEPKFSTDLTTLHVSRLASQGTD